MNPLHVDPDMAEMGGFKKPILHGLCTYGVTCWLLIEKFGYNSLEEYTARFTSHVFPGETLILKV